MLSPRTGAHLISGNASLRRCRCERCYPTAAAPLVQRHREVTAPRGQSPCRRQSSRWSAFGARPAWSRERRPTEATLSTPVCGSAVGLSPRMNHWLLPSSSRMGLRRCRVSDSRCPLVRQLIPGAKSSLSPPVMRFAPDSHPAAPEQSRRVVRRKQS